MTRQEAESVDRRFLIRPRHLQREGEEPTFQGSEQSRLIRATIDAGAKLVRDDPVARVFTIGGRRR